MDPERCFSTGEVEGFSDLDAVRRGQPRARPDERLAGQFMQYTSGTTGRPKAVRRDIPDFDPDSMVAMLAPNLTRYDIEPGGDHVHLVTSPMYHMAPLGFSYISLHFEHTLVLMESWDPEKALELIERHRVTTTHMVPTQFHRLSQLPAELRQRYDVSSLSNVMHAAAPCPVDLKRRMLEWWGPVIYEYYGATEGGGTMVRPKEWLEHPGTVGRPWPGAGVKILDDEGKELPTGEIGTVYMKLMVPFDYKDDPEKTRASRQGDRGRAAGQCRGRRCRSLRHPASRLGRGGKGGGGALSERRVAAGPRGSPDGVLPEGAGQLQAPPVHRHRRRAAARSQRQALQAQAPRPLLGRSRESDLSLGRGRGARRGQP